MISRLEKRVVAFFVAIIVAISGLPYTTLQAQAAECEDTREIVQDVVTEDSVAAGETVVYSFVPSETATYKVTTIGEGDTVGHIYDADWNVLYSDNDSGEGLNYQLEAALTAGTLYYLESGFFMEGDAGTIQTVVSEAVAEDTEEVSTSTEEAEETVEAATEETVADVEEENPDDATSSDALQEEEETVDASTSDYEYEVVNNGVRILKYIGSAKTVKIPEKIAGKYVTKIGDYAFKYSDITSVSIPSKVTEVQYGAFSYCEDLKNVTFASNNTLKTIGEQAFMGCGFTKIQLPDSVQTMGGYSFTCAALTSFTFPKSIQKVGDAALAGTDITKIVLSSNKVTYGDAIFEDCKKLYDVTLPDTMIEIPKLMFWNTTSLKKIVFPANLQIIRTSAFISSGLETLNLPSKLKTIEDYAFCECKIQTITFPDSLTYMGKGVFYGCDKLTTVKLGKGLKTIPEETFGFTAVKNIDFGSASVISPRAFMSAGFQTLKIPSTVTDIQYVAFYGNKNLTSITLPSNLLKLDGYAFHDTKWYQNKSNGIVYAGKIAYNYKGTAGTKLTLASDTTSIAAAAFYNQTNVTSVSLPVTLKYVNKFAFYNCTGLKKVVIPASVNTIDAYAFGYEIADWNDTNAVEVSDLDYHGFYYAKKITGFTIVGYAGTAAERYAKQNGFKFEAQKIPTVTGVKAVPAGKNKVTITWNKTNYAQGYIIYAQKNGTYAFCGMTTSQSATTFTDTKALDTDYNFYRVFAYRKDVSGKKVYGSCDKYVYAKGITTKITNLKAASVTGGVKLNWTKSADAAGYIIYRRVGNGKFEYLGMTSQTTYTDKKASKNEYNFYRVYPYHKTANGKRVIGETCAKYVYGKAK